MLDTINLIINNRARNQPVHADKDPYGELMKQY